MKKKTSKILKFEKLGAENVSYFCMIYDIIRESQNRWQRKCPCNALIDFDF